MTKRIVGAQADDGDWRIRLQQALEAFAREIESRPWAIRLALVEAFSAGPAVLKRIRSTEQAFESIIVESFARAPGEVEVPPLLIKGVVAGIFSMARAQLLVRGEEAPPNLAEALAEWVLALHSNAVIELAALDRSLLAQRPVVGASGEGKLLTFGQAASPKADERELILAAVSKITLTDGYGQLTVPRICAASGVRRKAFGIYFDGVTDCFCAALELRAYRALEYANHQAVSCSDWASGISRGTAAFCEWIASDPLFAKLAFIDASASGSDGIRCREGIMAAIASRFRSGASPAQRPSRFAAEASVGAVWGILHHYVVSGRAQQLRRLAPILAFLVLAPTIGPLTAAECIRREMDT
jgi:AcrR family transcriptional regulator